MSDTTHVRKDYATAAVDTCPSRALTYTRLDGKAPGSNGVPADQTDECTPDDVHAKGW